MTQGNPQDSGVGGYNLYHGLGCLEAVDWEHPVAHAAPDASQIEVPIAINPAETHVFAIRRVSQAGVEEHSTHVWTIVQRDIFDNFLSPPLAEVQDLTAAVCGNGEVVLAFTYLASPPYVPATGFEIFTNNGTGGDFNLLQPLMTLEDVLPGQSEFAVRLSGQILPTDFGVRPLRFSQQGPLGQVHVATVLPASLQIL